MLTGARRHSIRGFGLVEVMVSVSILSIVTLALMELSAQIAQSKATAERGASLSNLYFDFNTLFQNPDLCTQALGAPRNTDISTIPTLIDIPDLNGQIALQPRPVGDPYKFSYDQLGITTLRIENIANANALGTVKRADVLLEGESMTNVSGSKGFRRTWRMYFITDPTELIVRCLDNSTTIGTVLDTQTYNWTNSSVTAGATSFSGSVAASSYSSSLGLDYSASTNGTARSWNYNIAGLADRRTLMYECKVTVRSDTSAGLSTVVELVDAGGTSVLQQRVCYSEANGDGGDFATAAAGSSGLIGLPPQATNVIIYTFRQNGSNYIEATTRISILN
jgi:prepilin-type N-terminal cleavage/methylation domain-containing protein